MSYTFGAATSDRVVDTTSPTDANNDRLVLNYAWVYPTTLTAGRAIAGYFGTGGGAGFTGAQIDTTTTQLRIKSNHATTDGEWTTSDAGLVVNKWSFLAWAIAIGATTTVAVRAWSGTVDSPPQELTVTSAVAVSGNHGGDPSLVVGNNTSSSPVSAFQGDIAEAGGLATGTTAARLPPAFLASSGAITNAEAEFLLKRFVVPMWRGEWPIMIDNPRRLFNTDEFDSWCLLLNNGPTLVRRVMRNTETPFVAAAITGATYSQRGHPRGRHGPLLHPPLVHGRRM